MTKIETVRAWFEARGFKITINRREKTDTWTKAIGSVHVYGPMSAFPGEIRHYGAAEMFAGDEIADDQFEALKKYAE